MTIADDACLTLSHKDPHILENKINKELENINSWLKSNKLFLNYKKTNYLIFSKRKTKYHLNIVINNQKLIEQDSTKYLGITIDNKLSWQPHLKNLQTTLSRGCYALSKLVPYANQYVMKSVYYSLIYSKLQYCITSWGSCSNSKLNTIIKLQKRAIRILAKEPYRSHTHPLFAKLKLIKLKDIYRLNMCILIRKIKDNNIIGDLTLNNLNTTHNYNTRLRNNDNFYINHSKTNIGKTTFHCNAPRLWQDVPTRLKNLSVPSFKHNYKHFIINSYNEEE